MRKYLILLLCVVNYGFAKTTEKIEAEIKAHKNVLVHVHADWCPTCKEQMKVFKKIEDRNFEIVEVNFDKDKDFLSKNKVFKQSMILAYIDGKEVKRVFGITKKDKIMKFINESFNDSLEKQLKEKRASSKISNEKRKTMEDAIKELEESGIIAKATKKGNKAIDFTLKDSEGNSITLSEEYKKQPIILTFYRGGWCPYCNLQLRAYQEKLAEFKEAGGKLIAISPESKESASETSQKNKTEFPILTDSMNTIARKYGLVFKLNEELKEIYLSVGLDLEKNQGNTAWELPIPATYVIDTKGNIVYSFLNVDYVQRAEPADIISELVKLK